jgi:hypothetical protein
MKRHLSHLVILAGLFALMLMNSPSAQSDNDKADKADQPEKLLRHVVLFKFKESATQQQIDEVVKGFGELPEKIDAIHDYEWGTNNSPEDHAKGYTHCFLVTFKSEADRDAYLPHPAHQEFVKILLPILDEVHVVDYWAQR